MYRRVWLNLVTLLCMAAATSALADNNMQVGDRLAQGDFLISNNGEYRLNFQGDGNVVLRSTNTGDALWASGSNRDNGSRLSLQGDGNLVIRNDSGNAVWASGTVNAGVSSLVLNNDGSLAIYAGNTPVWAVNGDGISGGNNEQGGAGTITRHVWTDIPGVSVEDLTSHPNYPNSPDITDELSSFEAPSNWADYYGTRVVGYLHAPVSGEYTFWIASDDNGELWLSTDESASNRRRIAYMDGWARPREWDKRGQQQSVAITLEAGQRYYIEALQKEHRGGDNLAVAWQTPNGSREVIPGDYLSPYTGDDSDTDGESDTDDDSADSGHRTDSIAMDSGLLQDQWLESQNGDYRLYLQGDGNLVLRDTRTNDALWASGTDGDGGTILTLESSGNLVLYRDDGSVVWSSDTAGSGSAALFLDNEGSLSLMQDGNAIWSATEDSGGSTGGGSANDEEDSNSGNDGAGDGTAEGVAGPGVNASLGRFSTPDAALYSLNDSRERVFPEPINTGFNGNGHSVTMDGRIFVIKRSGRWGAVPLRPERITVNNNGTPNFRNGAFGREVELERESEAEAMDVQQNWVAIVPDHTSPRENPYPSNRNGDFRENGRYHTYDTLIYQTVRPGGNNRNRQLGYRRATFVMSDPKTPNAQLVSADFTSGFQRIRQDNGEDVNCIEMSVTMDGRLVICQGHPENNGRIDNIVYSWNETPNSPRGWSAPRSLADMYYVDRDADVDGVPLHVRFPIAREPIRDAAGDAYRQGELIKGAYPWISRDGSELFYQASREGVSARRTATTVVGRWTGWTLRHIDGPINPNRHASTRLFVSSPGAFTTMWQPFPEVENLNIPYSTRGPSFPIFGSNSRDYSEVGFDDYLDGNYVLAYGMNEQMARGGRFQTNRTPDTSGNFNNATLENGAAFPLEFNGNDRIEGRVGQGIYFPSGSYLNVNRNQGWDSLRDGVTVDMFVRRIDTGGGDVPLFRMANGIALYLANGSNLTGTIEDVDGNRAQVNGPAIPNGWSHVALRFDPSAQTLALFVDGRLAAEQGVADFGDLRVSGGVRIGPVNANALLMLDEVRVSNVAREAYEIGHNAYVRTHEAPSELLLNTIPDHLRSLSNRATAVEGFSFEAADLGETLFSDQILSRERTTSCATCHEPGRAFTDGLPIARGNEPTDDGRRNTPMLQNRLFSTFQGWGGDHENLVVQALDPIQAEHEMNLPIDQAVERLRTEGDYASRFESAFGEAPSAEGLALALASFQAIQFSAPTRVDDYLAGDNSALTAAEERGLRLFQGKARCSGCHEGSNFTDESFRAVGIADNGDAGRAEATGRMRDHKLFKVPSLRSVAQTGPYMHDGSLPSLRAVVEQYNEGAPNVDHVDTDIRPLELNNAEIDDIVTFLQALSGSGNTQVGVDNGGSTGSGSGNGDTPTSANSLFSGDTLNPNEQLDSADGSYRLRLQGDNNLVLRASSGDAVWSSGTVGSGGVRLNMQGDGNLVLRTASGQSVWSTGTHRTGANRVTLNNDGSLVIYQDSTVIQVVE